MKNILSTERMTKSFAGIAAACMIALTPAPVAWTAEDWKAAFDDICSKVDVSGTMSTKELGALVDRADKLMPEIQASNDSHKKVYLQRLKKCRSMYVFMIETKSDSGK